MDDVMKAAEIAVKKIIENVQNDKTFYLQALIYTLKQNDYTLEELKQIGLFVTDLKNKS